ncbi:MAG: glycosyltransferase [Acetatifactor sp.]|nr:glycosyltransferase [Acetatifactor sp.]
MRISVCMATYNGAKYIGQQLESILRQSRQPDEVILCDDGSVDETVHIIRKFIGDNDLQDTWRLYQNEQNKGYPGNFYYAMGLCSGDIVFLADQDDLWHREKIAHMCQVFEERQEAMVVCCKLSLIDAEGADIHSIMAPARETHRKGKGNLRQISIEDVFYKYEWPGMVMAYRQEWYRNWPAQDSGGIPHDFLISARAAEKGCFYQMDEVLACHRRHDNNAGGEEHRLGRLLQKERKLKEIQDYLQILQAFSQEAVLQTEAGNAALRTKLSSMQGRYDALRSGRLGQVLRNAGRHWRETRIKTLVCDLVIVLQ